MSDDDWPPNHEPRSARASADTVAAPHQASANDGDGDGGDPCGWKLFHDNSPLVAGKEPVSGYWRQSAHPSLCEMEMMIPFDGSANWSQSPKPHAILNAEGTVLTIRLPRDPAKGHLTKFEKYNAKTRTTHIILHSAVSGILAQSVHHSTMCGRGDDTVKEESARSFLCVLICKKRCVDTSMWPALSLVTW